MTDEQHRARIHDSTTEIPSQEAGAGPSRQIIEYLVLAASFVIIIAGIYFAQPALLPFLLSAFIAVLAATPLRWLRDRHVPSGLSIVLIVAGLVVLVAIFIVLVALAVRSISEALPEYQVRFDAQIAQAQAMLERHGIRGSSQVFRNLITPEDAAGLLIQFLSRATSAFSNIVIIVLTVIFLLLEESTFPGKLRAAFGVSHGAFPRFAHFANDLKRVVVIQTLISLGTGIIIGLWLFILGIDFPILLGLLTFLLNFVPNIGSIIAAVPAILIAYIQHGIGRALLASIGFVAVGTLVGNVLQPRLMGHHLGLSNLVVFLSVIFWGSLLGVIGMMLCVPFTLAVKFALESSEQTRWIAVLLERPPHETEPPTSPPASNIRHLDDDQKT